MNYIKNRILMLAVIILLALPCFYLVSCEETPSDLGLIYLPPDDTTGTNVLNSQTDTMLISSSNFKLAVNTSASGHLLIGKYQGYDSRALLKFRDITPDYDSSNIISAVLIMRRDAYEYRDSTGSVSFEAFKLNRDLNFSSITRDSLQGSDIDGAVLGSYTGAPNDSDYISFALNNQVARDWLEYAANSSYPTPNNGIALVPTNSSNTIKSFYAAGTSFDPTLQIILSKNNNIDTLYLSESNTVSLSDAPLSVIPADRFVVQSGVALRSILKFDLAKLPANVVINDARLELTLDRANSFLTSETNIKLGFGFITNSVTNTDSLLTVPANQVLTGDTYLIKLTSMFQYWNSGIIANNGASMFSSSERVNLDAFTFYAPSYSDPTKVPKLRIIYTLRNQ